MSRMIPISLRKAFTPIVTRKPITSMHRPVLQMKPFSTLHKFNQFHRSNMHNISKSFMFKYKTPLVSPYKYANTNANAASLMQISSFTTDDSSQRSERRRSERRRASSSSGSNSNNGNRSSDNANHFKNKSPYEVLGITKHATTKEIKMAYYRAAKEHHPDMHSHGTKKEKDDADIKFKVIAAAYELLSDPSKRASYDSASAWGGNSTSNSWKENTQRSNSSNTQQWSGHWYQQQQSYNDPNYRKNMWTDFVTGKCLCLCWCF
jgi:hypothetical protein